MEEQVVHQWGRVPSHFKLLPTISLHGLVVVKDNDTGGDTRAVTMITQQNAAVFYEAKLIKSRNSSRCI